MPAASATLTLPGLIGVSVPETSCRLTAEQLGQLASVLLGARPQDPQAVCFLGGALGSLARAPAGQQVIPLDTEFGDDPFLVIAGSSGALTLLTSGVGQLRARLFSDPDVTDRAALVLAQFGDVNYGFDAKADQETQRAFFAGMLATLVQEPSLHGLDLDALVPDDRRWLALTRGVIAQPERSALLGLPAVRQMLSEAGATRALVAQLGADQQTLVVIANDGGAAPGSLAVQGLLHSAIRTSRIATAADVSAAGGWVAGGTLIAAPLPREGRVWGVLLAAGERAFAGAARATLSGLAALLARQLFTAASPTAATIAVTPPLSSIPASSSQAMPSPFRPGTAPAPAIPFAPLPPAPATLPASITIARPSASAPSERAEPAFTPAPLTVRTGGAATNKTALVAPLLEQLSDSVFILDGQGRLLGFSQQAAHLLGLTPAMKGNALVESPAAFLAPVLAAAVLDELDGPQAVELPNGAHATVSVMGLEHGTWAFLVRTASNTTPVVHATTSEHVPAISEIERIERFLTSFSNGMRAPLRALRDLIAQVPTAGELNDQQSRLIGQVVKLNSEIMLLVNDLFVLGQMRMQSPENKVPLRMDLLIEAAVGTQYAEFGRRGQKVDLDIPLGLPQVLGSEEGLWRAVTALLDNAIKYCPTGAHILVGLMHQDREVVVTVRDNGDGLAADDLELVFDPFYRAANAERMGVAGRGLGLTIAKAVIEQHGGRLWATSASGQGATFAFSLPCIP
jgi:signal transduction histidine kinase